MTSSKASKALVDAVRADALVGDPYATYVHVRHGGHAMLRRAALWDELTADFVLQAALGVRPRARLAAAVTAGDCAL
jgi:hypothetical protein